MQPPSSSLPEQRALSVCVSLHCCVVAPVTGVWRVVPCGWSRDMGGGGTLLPFASHEQGTCVVRKQAAPRRQHSEHCRRGQSALQQRQQAPRCARPCGCSAWLPALRCAHRWRRNRIGQCYCCCGGGGCRCHGRCSVWRRWSCYGCTGGAAVPLHTLQYDCQRQQLHATPSPTWPSTSASRCATAGANVML